MIKDTSNLKPNDISVIYLDKNHPKHGIADATRLIDQNMPGGIEYTKLYMIPKIENDLIPDFPFSFEMVGQCLLNGLNRKDHSTLDNSDVPKMFGIMLMFLNFNF